MDKTQINVYFSLFGDEFPIDDITEKLKITPTEIYKKGDLIPNRQTIRYRKETSWNLATGYQNSLDVNEQLRQIVGILQNKSSIIKEIKQDYSLECKFYIVIIINDGNSPAFYMDKDLLKFIASIEAEIDIDLYANPRESNLIE